MGTSEFEFISYVVVNEKNDGVEITDSIRVRHSGYTAGAGKASMTSLPRFIFVT